MGRFVLVMSKLLQSRNEVCTNAGGGKRRGGSDRRAAAAVNYAPRPPAGSTLRLTATSMRCQTVLFTLPSCYRPSASPGLCAGRRGRAAVRRRRHLTSPAHHRRTLKRRRQGALPLYFSDNIPPSSGVCAWKLLQLLHRCEAAGQWPCTGAMLLSRSRIRCAGQEGCKVVVLPAFELGVRHCA